MEGDFMPRCLHNANLDARAFVCETDNDYPVPFLQTNPMAKKKKTRKQADEPHHYLAAWREFRGKTQEQLGAEVGTNKSVISLIESGQRGLSDKWRRRLAPALKTSPGWLDYDPNNLPSDILEIWPAVPEHMREQAIDILRTFVKKAS
jgi:DNA-binding XRE family transcriptional regulator